MITHPSPDLALLDFIFGCPVFRRSPIPLPIGSVLLYRHPSKVPTRPGAAGLHLRLSRFPAVTHPTVDRARCCLTFFFDGGHPSKCRPRLVWWTLSSVPFSGGHPSHCRPSPAQLDLFLRLSSLQDVTHPRAVLARFSSAPRFRLSRFPTVTHPTASRARCCLTLFFDCLLFR